MDQSSALLGLLLLILGLAMIIAEIFLPTVGVLGVLGIITVIISAFVIHHADVPGTDIILPIVAGLAVMGGALVVYTAWFARKSLRQPVVTGKEGMVGAIAQAVESFSDEGRVRLHGELWNARTNVPVSKGQEVRVVKVDGLSLWVEPL